jgi:hypothetical protein
LFPLLQETFVIVGLALICAGSLNVIEAKAVHGVAAASST